MLRPLCATCIDGTWEALLGGKMKHRGLFTRCALHTTWYQSSVFISLIWADPPNVVCGDAGPGLRPTVGLYMSRRGLSLADACYTVWMEVRNFFGGPTHTYGFRSAPHPNSLTQILLVEVHISNLTLDAFYNRGGTFPAKRRSTIEIHPNVSEALNLRSSAPHPDTEPILR